MPQIACSPLAFLPLVMVQVLIFVERGSEGKWEWLTPALRSGDAGRLSSSEEPSICNAVWLKAKQVARNAFCLKCSRELHGRQKFY
jgi:hypothetical protein